MNSLALSAWLDRQSQAFYSDDPSSHMYSLPIIGRLYLLAASSFHQHLAGYGMEAASSAQGPRSEANP